MNRVRLAGRLGAPPEFTASGALKLRVWTDDGEWHRVMVVDARAPGLGASLKKGDTLVIEGRLRTVSYEANGARRYVTDVVASRVFRAIARSA